ncbi:hypothetical protein SAMN06264365_127114 [Actinoplanes regularis]|uniref:Uncharacterized protein n=1 Tax=Actinoplanes regularis TaxID=52697 RepID=A0A239IA62_9ACTN|nr:hypothetical protein Are01nite_77980 [Actinoplanes regularis]SNS89254.1 hypothetical protein SAMN06264365_127114 [Actinoplanes regularis]
MKNVNFDRVQVQNSADRLAAGRQRLARAVVASSHDWSPAQQEMLATVATPPDDIAGVIDRLKAVQKVLDTLPPSPGTNRVAAFNTLYLTITEQVATSLTGPDVTDPDWLETLDVEFARLYFKALGAWGVAGADPADAWEVLFRRAHDDSITPMDAAVLGVNAHINHDLALAVVATWHRLGYSGDRPQHPDYLLVNRIFYQQIPLLRRRFATAWQLEIDRCVGDLDDWSQNILVRTTRALAWEQAEILWHLRDDPKDLARALQILDRASACAGETLLTGTSLLKALWLTASAWAKRLFKRA